MHKIGWFAVVRGHPRLSAMLAFDRAHMTSYLSLTETMRPSSTVFEIRRVICRNSPTLTTPPAFDIALGGDAVGISKRFMASEN